MPSFPNRRTFIDHVEGVTEGTTINNAELTALQSRQEEFVNFQSAILQSNSGYISHPWFLSPSARRITLQMRYITKPFVCFDPNIGYWAQSTELSIDYNALQNGVAYDRYDYLYLELYRTIATGQVGFRLNIYQNNNSPTVLTTPDVTTSSRNISIEESHCLFPLLKTRRYQTVQTPEEWGYGEDNHIFIGVAARTNIAAVQTTDLITNLNAEYLGGYNAASFLSFTKANLITELYNIIGDETAIMGLWLFDSQDEDILLKDRSFNANNGVLSTYPRRLSPEKKGLAYTLKFDDSSKYFEIPDHSKYTFSTGANDLPFSIVTLANPSNVAISNDIISKADFTSGSKKTEWRFGFQSNLLAITLFDNNFSSHNYLQAYIDVTQYSNSFHTFITTYDGSSTPDGLNLFVDSVELQTTKGGDYSNYSCMRNTAAAVKSCVVDESGGNIEAFKGQYALVMILNLELSQDQISDLNSLLRSYTLDTELYYRNILSLKNKGKQQLTGNVIADKNCLLSNSMFAEANFVSYASNNSYYPSIGLWLEGVFGTAIYLTSSGELRNRSSNGKDTAIQQFHGILDSAPSAKNAGDTYKNSNDDKYYIYNGTSWDALT